MFIKKIRTYFQTQYSNALKQEQKNIALRKLLTFARGYSPWYHKLLKNVSIESFTQDHLHTVNKFKDTL